LREFLDDPRGLALDIMELRAYARAKDALDNAKKEEDIPKTAMVEVVWQVQHEIMKRKKRKRVDKHG